MTLTWLIVVWGRTLVMHILTPLLQLFGKCLDSFRNNLTAQFWKSPWSWMIERWKKNSYTICQAFLQCTFGAVFTCEIKISGWKICTEYEWKLTIFKLEIEIWDGFDLFRISKGHETEMESKDESVEKFSVEKVLRVNFFLL